MSGKILILIEMWVDGYVEMTSGEILTNERSHNAAGLYSFHANTKKSSENSNWLFLFQKRKNQLLLSENVAHYIKMKDKKPKIVLQHILQETVIKEIMQLGQQI